MLKFHRPTVAVALCAAAAFASQTLFASDPPSFATPLVVRTAINAGNGDVLVMGDFNGDGIPDVAILGSVYNTNNGVSTGVVEVHFGNGANGFLSEASTFTNATSSTEFGGNLAQELAAADLDGGTNTELIVPAGNAVLVYEWSGTRFIEKQSIDLSGTGMTSAYWLAVGNLTTTNSQDIIVVDTFGAVGVVWIPNDGHGNFGTPVAFPLGGPYAAPDASGSRPLVLANVNGKNKLDDVILSWASTGYSTAGSTAGSTVGVLLNQGDGTLSSEVSYGNPTLVGVTNTIVEPLGLAVADVDGDGKLDLVSICYSYNTVTGAQSDYLSVNLGNGDGTFQVGKAFSFGAQGLSSIAAADLTGDGRVDIVSTDGSQLEGGFTVTEWSGTGTNLAVAEQDDYAVGSQYFNSLLLGYKTANGAFVTFNNDKKVDVLMGTSDVLYDTNNIPYSQFDVFQNDTVLKLSATSLNILGKIAPGGPILFYATQTSTPSGLSVRVQWTTTTNIEGSWTDLADGHGGQLALTLQGIYSFGTNGTVYYPGGAAIYFRAISSAPGYADSISPVIGPKTLEQAQLVINVHLTSTSDPTGALQVAHIGDTLTYTFVWTNIGNATAHNLHVETPVPTYIDATSDLIFQFARTNLTYAQYGAYTPESQPGAGNASVTWAVSDLPPGSSQAVTLAVRLGSSVRLEQMIGLPNNYQVYSSVNEPPTAGTGFSSGATNIGTTVLGPFQLTITPDVTNVAPGGLINYTIKIQNFASYTASNVVIADPAPEFTRFVPYNSVTKIGTTFVNSKGAPIASPAFAVKVANKAVAVNNPLRLIGLYPSNSLAPSVQTFLSDNLEIVPPSDFADQAVFYVGNLAKDATAIVRFTVQAEYIDPADVLGQEIKNFDYLAYFDDPSGNIVETKNESGLVFTPVQGAVRNAPDLSLVKAVSAASLTPGATFFVGLVAHNSGASAAEDVFIQDRLPQGASTVNPILLTVANPPQIISSGSSQTQLNAAISFIGGSASITESKANYFVTLATDGTITVHGLHLEPNATVAIAYLMRVPSSTPVPETLAAGASFIGSGNGDQTIIGSGTNQFIATVPGGTPQEIAMRINGDIQLFTPAHPFEAVPAPMVSLNPAATATNLDALYKKNINASLIVPKSNPPMPIPGVQRYFIHYQNTGTNIASDVHLLFPTPPNTEFYRASYVATGGILASPAKAQSISEPLKLGSGNVIFNLGNLKAGVGSGGYVMVEVILLPTAINPANSRILAATPQLYQGAQPVNVARKLDDASDNGGTIVYDGQNVPQIGIVKIVPQAVQQGGIFSIQFAVFNYGNVDVDEGAEVTVQAPAGTQIVGLTGLASVNSSNATSLDLSLAFVKHYASGFAVQFLATGAAGTAIAENSIVANVPYCGTFTPNPTSIQIVGAQQAIPNNTITSVLGAQFVTLGEMAVIPLGQYEPGVGTALVCGPSSLFGDLQSDSIISDSGSGTFIVAGRAQDLPLLNLPVLTNTDTKTALEKLSTIVGQHGGNIFNGPQANLLAADGESFLDNNTGAVASTVTELLKAGAQSVIASGAGTLPALGNAGPAVVGGGVASVAGGGRLLTSGAGLIANDGGSLISQDGGGLISQDGGGLISQDGGGLIGSSGSTLVTDNGGAVVSNDGGSLVGDSGATLISSLASAAIAQTAGGNIVSSGAGNIVSSGAGNIVSSGAGN